jgi:hypothetical protein
MTTRNLCWITCLAPYSSPTYATRPAGLAHAIPHFLITAFRRVAKELHLASIKRIDDQE